MIDEKRGMRNDKDIHQKNMFEIGSSHKGAMFIDLCDCVNVAGDERCTMYVIF